MIYQIPLKKLRKIANPFEQACLEGLSEGFSKEKIAKFLAKGDIFSNDDIKDTDNHYREVAYEILNYNKNNGIEINLNNTRNGWIVTKGIYHLVASLLKVQEFINAEIIGDSKNIETLFGNVQPLNKTIKTREKFLWNINEVSLKSSWESTEFILKEYKINDKNKYVVNPALAMIPPTKWQDLDFLEKIIPHLNIFDLKSIPEEIKYSSDLLQVSKNQYLVFAKLWEAIYKPIFEPSSVYREIVITPEKIKLKQEIQTTVFSDKEMCKSLFEYAYSIDFLYPHYSLERKLDKDLLALIFKSYKPDSHNRFDLLKDFPPEFFQDTENVLKLLKIKNIYSSDIQAHFYEPWINDKDKLLTILNHEKVKPLDAFFKYMSQEFQTDKEIISAFIKNSPDIYDALDKKIQNDLDIIKKLIDCGGIPNYEKNKLVFTIEDTDYIKKMVEKDSNILLHKNCPPHWLENIDILLSIPAKDYIFTQIPKRILNKVLADEENCLFLLQQDKSIYEYISDTKKLSYPLSLEYIHNMDRDIKYKLPHIPLRLWAQKDFCIMALSENIETLPYIPKQFFYEKDFIINFCSRLDRGVINSQILNHTPKEIKQLFDAMDVTNNYEKFITSYMFSNKLEKDLKPTEQQHFKKHKI